MAEVYLVCEGARNGLDSRLLDRALAQIHDLPVIIRPAGGDSGIRAIRRYLQERSRPLSRDGTLGREVDAAFGVLDRDYRPLAQAEKTWEDRSSRVVMWRRHEIENYLLEPQVVLAAFKFFRATVRKDWVKGLPQDVEETRGLLRTIAEPLLEDHAGHLLAWELRENLSSCACRTLDVQPPPSVQDKTYSDRNAWTEALCRQIERLVKDCSSVDVLPFLRRETVLSRYDEILEQVRKSLGTCEFIIDVDGHDLLRALHDHLHDCAAGRLSLQLLEDELVDAFENVYRSNNALYQHDEFSELARRIQSCLC